MIVTSVFSAQNWEQALDLKMSANAITLSDSLLHAAFMSTLGDIYETTNIGSPNRYFVHFVQVELLI